jgi:hypothetical protein
MKLALLKLINPNNNEEIEDYWDVDVNDIDESLSEIEEYHNAMNPDNAPYKVHDVVYV